MHHGCASGNPAPLVDEPDRRQLTERPPLSRRVPIDLLIVRSGGQHHLAFYATGSEWRVTRHRSRHRSGTDPPTPTSDSIGVVELRPQLVATLLERHRRPPPPARRRSRPPRTAGSPPASSSGGRTRATRRTGWDGRRGRFATRRSGRSPLRWGGRAAGGPAAPCRTRKFQQKWPGMRDLRSCARAGMGASFLPRSLRLMLQRRL